jgi:hypothetical protein
MVSRFEWTAPTRRLGLHELQEAPAVHRTNSDARNSEGGSPRLAAHMARALCGRDHTTGVQRVRGHTGSQGARHYEGRVA